MSKKKSAGIDYNLRFMAEILGLNYLHWGYFPPERRPSNQPPTLAEVKRAQEDYTEHLLSYIPNGVETVLDVGCGLGATAGVMADRGLRVTCLSNDSYQESVIGQKYPDLRFVKSKFEEAAPGNGFDLVLMSESPQYLNWPNALAKLAEVLRPGGYLLLADYFRLSDDQYYHTCHVLSDFKTLTEGRFRLLMEEDITDGVLPTLDFGSYCFERYIQPASRLLREMISDKTSPALRWIAGLFLRKQLRGIEYYLYDKMPRKFDRHLFGEKLRYLMQLWQLK